MHFAVFDGTNFCPAKRARITPKKWGTTEEDAERLRHERHVLTLRRSALLPSKPWQGYA